MEIKLSKSALKIAAKNGIPYLREMYEAEVHRLVRERDSEGEENAITNKFLLGDTEEFYAKVEYVSDCKRAVKKYIKEVTSVEL